MTDHGWNLDKIYEPFVLFICGGESSNTIAKETYSCLIFLYPEQSIL